jgi:hypothetical protein
MTSSSDDRYSFEYNNFQELDAIIPKVTSTALCLQETQLPLDYELSVDIPRIFMPVSRAVGLMAAMLCV